MISDEIEGMRGAGVADEEIARIIEGVTGRCVSARDLARFYAPPSARGRS